MARLFVPLDVDFQDDPKLIRAGALAELVFIRSLALAKKLLSDGRIDRAHLARLTLGVPGKAERHAEALVREGLWSEVDGGWVIAAYLSRNDSRAEVEAKRQARRLAGQRGNHERWHGEKRSPGCPFCDEEASQERSHLRSHLRSQGIAPAIAPAIAPGSPETETETEIEIDGSVRVATATNGSPAADGAASPPSHDEKRRRRSRAPASFAVTDELRAWAAEKQLDLVDLDAETERFLDHHRAKGSLMSDWTAAWRTWMRRAQQYAAERGRPERNDSGWRLDANGNRVMT